MRNLPADVVAALYRTRANNAAAASNSDVYVGLDGTTTQVTSLYGFDFGSGGNVGGWSGTETGHFDSDGNRVIDHAIYGLSEIIGSGSPEDILPSALDWYKHGVSTDRLDAYTLPEESTTTQFLRGLALKLEQTRGWEDEATPTDGTPAKRKVLMDVASSASFITGIPGNEFVNVVEGNPSIERMVIRLINVLRNYGYEGTESFFVNPTKNKVFSNGEISDNGIIQLRFDYPDSEDFGEIESVKVFAFTSSDNGIFVDEGNPNTLYVNVDASKLPAVRDIGFEIQVQPVNGEVLRMSRQIDAINNPEIVTYEGLSTLEDTPENAERRDRETVILNNLKENFVLLDLSNWSWLIASPAHKNHAFNSVDLSASGTIDDKAPITAPAAGTIALNREDSEQNPTLVLEHKSTVNGHEFYWYTKYLHMYHDTDGKSGVLNGDGVVEQGWDVGTKITNLDELFAHVGHFGNNGNNYETHLHFETFMRADGSQIPDTDQSGNAFFGKYETVDMRLLLADKDVGFGLPVSATPYQNDVYGKSLTVGWNNDLNTWVNNSLNLIYNRSQMAPGNPASDESYWVAHHPDPTQRERVVWKSLRVEGELEEKGRWVRFDNDRLEWDGNNWITINPIQP